MFAECEFAWLQLEERWTIRKGASVYVLPSAPAVER